MTNNKKIGVVKNKIMISGKRLQGERPERGATARRDQADTPPKVRQSSSICSCGTGAMAMCQCSRQLRHGHQIVETDDEHLHW